MAAMVGNVDIVKMLIKANCDCRVVNKKQYSVLHCAVKHDQNEIVAYFLDNVSNLDINAVNEVSGPFEDSPHFTDGSPFSLSLFFLLFNRLGKQGL